MVNNKTMTFTYENYYVDGKLFKVTLSGTPMYIISELTTMLDIAIDEGMAFVGNYESQLTDIFSRFENEVGLDYSVEDLED